MTGKIRVMVLLVLMLLGLAACKEELPEETTAAAMPEIVETPEETTEQTLPETTAAPDAGVLTDAVSGKVCVGFLPTDGGGGWRYAVIEDQQAAVAAYEKAAGAIYSDEWWIKGDRTKGLMVVYGEIWDFVESGELVYSLGRVAAEDAADLLALCEAAAREAGWKEAVKPEQLTDVVWARLRSSGKEITLEDAAALDQLEAMLSGAEYELGGTGCPFTALLDVERVNGQVLTIALATDSCGAWMSEGYYYSYGSDSQPLYDLFGVTLEAGRIVE